MNKRLSNGLLRLAALIVVDHFYPPITSKNVGIEDAKFVDKVIE